jgi:hypothetical protein
MGRQTYRAAGRYRASTLEGKQIMSKAHMPPVPPANRSPMGGSANPKTSSDMSEQIGKDNKESRQRLLEEQGRQGNIKQNTTNQGYTQDR